MAPPGYAPVAGPGQGQMAPPGYVPITVPPAASNSIALWATILTGAYAAIGILGAVTAPATVEGLKQRLEDPQNASLFAGQSPASFLSFPLSVASFVLLALWMSRIRAARTAKGETIGGPRAVEWWGWFVPLANIVLPFLGMRAITKARAGMGLLLGWWITFVVSGALSVAAAIPTVTALDWSTGKLAHPEALDPIVGLTWASAIFMVVSWVFLAVIIRVTTRREADAS
jgi:hypothetical protein